MKKQLFPVSGFCSGSKFFKTPAYSAHFAKDLSFSNLCEDKNSEMKLGFTSKIETNEIKGVIEASFKFICQHYENNQSPLLKELDDFKEEVNTNFVFKIYQYYLNSKNLQQPVERRVKKGAMLAVLMSIERSNQILRNAINELEKIGLETQRESQEKNVVSLCEHYKSELIKIIDLVDKYKQKNSWMPRKLEPRK
jgi:Na+/phosphate symporter